MSLGEILGTAQSASAANSTNKDVGKLANDFDSFLTILTTQLKNQDPTSPVDTKDFTNQLVQFAQVEQQLKQSGYLEQLTQINRGYGAINAVSYVGKYVKADYNEFKLKADSSGAYMGYTLPQGADKASISIYDNEDNLIYTAPVDTDKGEHSFAWDGKNASGNPMLPGQYYFTVNAVDGDGKDITDIGYATYGKVSGVEYAGGKTILDMDGIKFDLEKVISVNDTGAFG